MTGTPPQPPQPPQSTKIQWSTLIKHLKNLRLRPVATGVVILASSLFLLEKYNDLVQFHESVCRNNPSSSWCPSPPPNPPEWIGTKIEDVYIKKLKNYEIETTLVVTDKSPSKEEKKDISVLRNVDQELSQLDKGKKTNSGQYEAILRKAKNNRKPLCIRIYGNRNFETSEFKNIIGVREDFPPNQSYDTLTSEERDQECEKKYGSELNGGRINSN